MNSTRARDTAINLMNKENKELEMEFLMQHLEIEDLNSHHKSQSHLDSTASVIKDQRERRTAGMESRLDRNHKGIQNLLILHTLQENPKGWKESA